MSPSGRLSGSLPVSIGVHCVVLGALLLGPLTSGLNLPGLPIKMAAYVAAWPYPPPPLVRQAQSPSPSSAAVHRTLHHSARPCESIRRSQRPHCRCLMCR